MRHVMTAIVALLVCLCSAPVVAWDHRDVEAMLREPGVRLVAIDFWAEWCKPCKQAIPKWREVHEKYWHRGLRLIVVAVESEGTCAYPGWKPDEVVCDEDGKIAKRWGVGDLPQAFLWSWQGKLEVERGEAEDVIAAVDRYFRETPRILVETPVGADGKEYYQADMVRDVVRAELRRVAKFELVASAKEREELGRYREEGYGLAFDDKSRCPLGQAVPANSVLRVRLEEARLLLQLFDLKTSCLIAQGRSPVAGHDMPALEKGAVQAVGKLVKALGVFEEPEAEGVGGEAIAAKAAALKVEGGPRGALVEVAGPDGFTASKGLPASFEGLVPGGYNVRVSLMGYKTVEKGVQLSGGRRERLKIRLQEVSRVTEHILKVVAHPGGAMVSVDGGAPKEASPEASFVLTAGKHTINVVAGEYLPWSKEVDLSSNKTVEAYLSPDFGSLEVLSEPSGATVSLDARRVGRTPLTVDRVRSGAHSVVLEKRNYHAVTVGSVKVPRGKRVKVSEVLPPRMGAVAIRALDTAGVQVVAEVFLDGKSVGETPLQKSLITGSHEVALAAPEGKWEGTVVVKEGKTATVEGTLVAGSMLRLSLSAGAGSVVHTGGVDRGLAQSEAAVGQRSRAFAWEVGAKWFWESPNHVLVQPALLYYPADWFFVRAGIPVRVYDGFDYGALLGPGVRFGSYDFAVFGEVDATVLSGSGFDAAAVEGRVGVELLF